TRTLYPYQAYWTSHTLQQWFSGDKDEKLSRLGIDGYIEKLALLGTTTDTKNLKIEAKNVFNEGV
ncbi:hypothetical protein MXE01_15625, partial [Legionella pneumophila]|nr:hypothetical protein [Legionella pneumophila]